MRALFTLYFSRLCRRCFGCFSRTGSPRHLERVAFQICPPANERSGIRLRPCGCASSFSKVNRNLCAERTCSVPKWRYTVLRDVSLTGCKQIIVPEGNSACCPYIVSLSIIFPRYTVPRYNVKTCAMNRYPSEFVIHCMSAYTQMMPTVCRKS